MTNKIKPQTLKGFRDFLPESASKRQYAINIIRRTFESFGFDPLETPALEYLETFKGQIGEDEKLFYKFQDTGGRDVALRYDQTVPTCRVIAQYRNEIVMPFKRYQIQTVWRAEKPQKGRYREFLQCDADIFGVEDRTADGETIALTIQVFKNLGFEKPIALINDRALYKDMPYKAIVSLDKLEKIGEAGVLEELKAKGFSEEESRKFLSASKDMKPNGNLLRIFSFLDNYGMKDNYRFLPTLARSFSYSTGTIWEIIDERYPNGSLAGCERFDSLVSKFSGENVPAVGFAIGFDRTVAAMEELGLFPELSSSAKVLVSVFNSSTLPYSQKIAAYLRSKSINSDLYPDPDAKLEKQMKYADRKKIPYAVIAGPDEEKNGTAVIKDLTNRTQVTKKYEEIPALITGS